MNTGIKSKVLSLIILCLFFSGSFSAQTDWFFVALNPDRKMMFLDRDFTRLPNGIMQVWTKSVHADQTSLRSLMEWNCPKKSSRVVRAVLYDTNGDVITRSSKATSWKVFVPDSTGMLMYHNICDENLGVNSNRPPKKISSSIAQIIIKNSRLMSDAAKDSKAIRKLAFNERLVLVGSQPVGVWYQVFDPKTNSEGWLNGNHFKIVKSAKP